MRNVDRSLDVLEPDSSRNRSIVSRDFTKANSNGSSSIASSSPRSAACLPTCRVASTTRPHSRPGGSKLLLKHIFAGDKAEVLHCWECRSKLDHVLGALDMIVTNGRIEVVETKTGTHQGYDRQIDAPHAIDISLALSDRHSPGSNPMKRSMLSNPIRRVWSRPGKPSYGDPNQAELINPEFHSERVGILVILRYMGTKS